MSTTSSTPNVRTIHAAGHVLRVVVGEGGGKIESDLKEPCPQCHSVDCENPACGTDATPNIDRDALDGGRVAYNRMVDGIEALILAHACAGIDVEDPKYAEGIDTALEAISNRE